jgi:hypothetical protein
MSFAKSLVEKAKEINIIYETPEQVSALICSRVKLLLAGSRDVRSKYVVWNKKYTIVKVCIDEQNFDIGKLVVSDPYSGDLPSEPNDLNEFNINRHLYMPDEHTVVPLLKKSFCDLGFDFVTLTYNDGPIGSNNQIAVYLRVI